MQILVTDSPGIIMSRQLKRFHQGFTLIEVLITIAIISIVTSIAILKIPNHDLRYLKNDLDQLVGSLNAGHDESMMNGQIMMAVVNEQGWTFSYPNQLGQINHGRNQTPAGSALMPDVYRNRYWKNAVTIQPIQISLGGQYHLTDSLFVVSQNKHQAHIARDQTGRFSWVMTQ